MFSNKLRRYITEVRDKKHIPRRRRNDNTGLYYNCIISSCIERYPLHPHNHMHRLNKQKIARKVYCMHFSTIYHFQSIVSS